MGRPFALLALLCGLAAPAHAVTPDQYEILFTPQKSVTYNPPPITSGLSLAYGDSRTANNGGVSYASPSFSTQDTYSNNWSQQIPAWSNGAVQYPSSFNYGVGAQTSAGEAGRLNLTGNFCNSPTNSSATGPCWTAAKTTTVGATTTTAMVVTSGTGIATGSYVFGTPIGTPVQLIYSPALQFTVSGVVVNAVTLSHAPSNSIPNATAVAFSPAAQTNPFWNFLDSAGDGYSTTDMVENIASTATYSPCTDPAKLVFFIGNVNDGSLTSLQSMTNDAAIFDGLGPKGCNKVVIAGNELPRGLSTAILEVHAVAATVTVTNGGTFFDDQGVYYAPSTVANAPVAGDGTALTKIAFSSGTSCATPPTTLQYCVNPANGVYIFDNTDDSGKQIVIQYRYGATSNAYLTTIHDWLNSSSCGSFTDPNTSTTYPISGAQCRRPWLKVADTWDTAIDSAIATATNPYPLPFYSIDGLHPLPAFGGAAAKVMAAAAASYVGSTPIIPLPTANNPDFAATSASSTGAATTTCAVGNNTNNYFLTALTPAVSTGVYVVGQKLYMNASTGVPAGTLIDCVDTTNSKIHMAQPATSAAAPGANIAQGDVNSIAVNAVVDHRNMVTTAITNCNSKCYTPSTGNTVTQGYMAGWTPTLSASNNTDLTAGTLAIGYGIETNPTGDGFDALIVQVQGKTTTAGLSLTFATGNNTFFNGSSNLITPGDQHRMVCRVEISAGPNGHLWGVLAPSVKVTDSVGSGNYQPPGAAASTYTNWSSTAGGSAPGLELTDKDLTKNGVAGVITMPITTTPTNTTGMTSPSSITTLGFSSDNAVPVSATFRISRCANDKVLN